MSEGIKKRWEAEEKDTWNMADMLPSDEAWEELFQKTERGITGYRIFRGELLSSGEKLYECLSFDERCRRDTELLYVYARQRSDEDTGNQRYQDMSQRAQALSFKAAEESSYLVPTLLEMEPGKLEAFYTECGKLLHYKRELELIFAKKPHTLSPELEELLAKSYEATQSPEQIYSMFNNADIRFPEIEGKDGEKVTVTHGTFIALMENRDRRIRKDAFLAVYGCYRQFSNTVAAIFSANVKQAAFYAGAKHYGSAREYYLAENEIPVDVYDNLLKAVHEALPLLHRYVSFRRQKMGLLELHMYDLYVPLVEDVARTYTFEEAKEMVLEGLKPLGSQYQGLLEEGFKNRWIDVYENEGKKSGAYSWGVYGSHPYVLLNYNGTLNYVFTLAHEMGHALHSYYSDHSQPYTYAGYKIFVAEVASTCNEALLIRHLLDTAGDKKERAFLINHFLESFRSTLFRQAMFAEFEAVVHKKAQEGETLTAEALRRIYHKLNEDYYGPDVVVDEEIGYEWERIPHFYTPFYVYQYATGFSAAVAISRRILAGEKGALEGYFQFLKGGNSMSPIDLLKLCGIDMSTPVPVREALDYFGELLDELERL